MSTSTVGRAVELDLLARRVAATRSDGGGLVLITGEAGIGKTRMLAEAAALGSARGMTILRGRSVAGGGPFRPIAEALVPAAVPALADHPRLVPYRSVLGRLLPGWPSDHGSDRVLLDPVVALGEAVLELVTVLADPGGAVVTLDDLHWADADSLGLLGYLAGRVSSSPVLLVASARDEEQAPPALAEMRRSSSATVVSLARLGPADVARLARDRAGGLADGAVELVVRGSDGLPLLVEELADAMRDCRASAIPRTVAELTRRRMDSLSAPAQEILRTAALLGSGVDWSLLPAACGHTEDETARALREAVDASLLVLDPLADGSLRWRHALTRDAVTARLLPAERAVIARRAAVALDDGDAPDSRLAIVAELYAQCGRRVDAARRLLTFARSALDAGALGSAEAALRRGIELVPTDHELVVELVRVLALAGRSVEATELGAGVLEYLDGERVTVLCLHLARAAVAAHDWIRARDYLGPVRDSGDARVDALRAHIALGTEDWDGAAALARSAADEGRRTGHHEAVCEALEVVGRALRRSDPGASERAFVQAEECAGRHGLTVWRIRALSELGANDMLRTARLDRLREAQQRAVDAGMLATAAVLGVQMSACVAMRDGHVASLPFAEAAIARADRLGLAPTGSIARYFAALGRLFAGHGDLVDPLLARARALTPDSADTIAQIDDLAAIAAWLNGDPVEALALFDRNRTGRRHSAAFSTTPSWGLRALIRVALHPTARVQEELRAPEISAQACNEGARHYADAVAAARAGRQAEADRSFAEGDQVMTGHRTWRHLMRMAIVEPAAREGFGAPERWLRAAHADLDGTGEVRLQRRCRELMRALGYAVPRTHRGTAPAPSGLQALGVTPREWQVLELIERGLTNTHIADRLFLSPRTVETHVASLLAKTGIARRTQLRGRKFRNHEPLSP